MPVPLGRISAFSVTDRRKIIPRRAACCIVFWISEVSREYHYRSGGPFGRLLPGNISFSEVDAQVRELCYRYLVSKQVIPSYHSALVVKATPHR